MTDILVTRGCPSEPPLAIGDLLSEVDIIRAPQDVSRTDAAELKGLAISQRMKIDKPFAVFIPNGKPVGGQKLVERDKWTSLCPSNQPTCLMLIPHPLAASANVGLAYRSPNAISIEELVVTDRPSPLWYGLLPFAGMADLATYGALLFVIVYGSR